MRPLPELGVGMIYAPGLEEHIQAGSDLIDVIEVEPQTCWVPGPAGRGRFDPAALAWLRNLRQVKLAHGVANPIGGSITPDAAEVAAFAQAVQQLDAPWCSEHLSFNRFVANDTVHQSGFLLPPLQSADHALRIASTIRWFARRMPVPFAFETGVNYLAPRSGELDDGTFFGTIADVADCGIVLDLHNLWCNQQNGRSTVDEVIAALPLDRIWEIHVAGGQYVDGYLLDAHSDLTPPQVMELAANIVPQMPNLRAIVFEIMPEWIGRNAISPSALREHLARLREIWTTRASRHTAGSQRLPALRPRETPMAASDYESSLGTRVTGIPHDPARDTFARHDEGIAVLGKLVCAVRAGAVVERLRLSHRLIVLCCGKRRFDELLRAFWSETSPRLFAAEEAVSFGQFLARGDLEVGGLDDVIAFELGAQRAQLEDDEITIRLLYDPQSLIVPLIQGRSPDLSAPGCYELRLSPAA